MKIRRAIVPAIAFALLATCVCALSVEFWFILQARAQGPVPELVPPTPFVPPEPLKPDVIAPTVGDCDLDFSPDASLLAAVDSKDQTSGQGAVRVYRIADKQAVANLGTGAACCGWSPDGSLLAVARTGPARLELWDTTTWTLSDTIAVPDPALPDAALLDDDGQNSHREMILSSLCVDRMQNVYVVARVESTRPELTRSHAYAWWNSRGGRSKELQVLGSYPRGEAFSLSASSNTPTMTVLAISYVCAQHAADHQEVPLEVLRIWRERGKRVIRQGEVAFLSHEACVRVSPDGKRLTTLTGSANAYRWNCVDLGANFDGRWSDSPQNNAPLDTSEMRLQSVDASSHRAVVIATEGESVSPKVVDFDEDYFSADMPRDNATAVSLSSDGRLLAVSTPGKGILVYHLP
jgi:WD40 repeat protein